MREIVIAHDKSRGPLVAVRRMLVHSSIAELKQFGLYERYVAVIEPDALEQILELIGPGWMPIELALKHYGACDRLGLTQEEIHAAGLRAGDKMSAALLVGGAQGTAASGTDRSPWEVIGAFSRMGRRIHEGGSAQYVKLAYNRLQIEHEGNVLFSLDYYRVAHAGFLKQSFDNLGMDITSCTFTAYRPDKAQIEYRLTWK